MGPKGLVGLLCVANLVAGVGLGVTVDRVAFAPKPAAARPPRGDHRRPRPDHPGPGEGGRGEGGRGEGGRGEGGRGERGRGEGRELQRLTERLELDKAQADQVREILAKQRPLFAELMKEMRPRVRTLREQTDAQVRAVLRPEQAAKFDELHREWDQRERERDQRERDGGENNGNNNGDGKTKDPGRGVAPVNTGDGRTDPSGGK